MKVVIGVDWSEEAFASVRQVFELYRPTEVTLVHGIDLGIFEYPVLAQTASVPGYEDFARAVTDAGHQVLDRAADLLPDGLNTVKKINETGQPAELIRRSAITMQADLVVVGARGRSRLTEVFLGSVSHRVVTQADRTTLIVKGAVKPVRRILVAVEGQEDAARIVPWLQAHPFVHPVEVCVLNVQEPVRPVDPYHTGIFQDWAAAEKTAAEDVVKTVGAALVASHGSVSTRVATGDVAETIAAEAQDRDLVVVSSHGRRGVDRLLMGSVSHAILHRVTGSVLVVR
ncbi:putative Universal stress protein [Nitrospira japonica]|uniref:Putative Universal stress protein n=1 Tax=Nitrospira japonica TaxID=1325564 RepID=A0A1W1I2M1_9BACT|nr:universal stress protein [Nitrospira japonica]SLM47258.1 putative Universal stress protein [Nitrospira japonica]